MFDKGTENMLEKEQMLQLMVLVNSDTHMKKNKIRFPTSDQIQIPTHAGSKA